MNTDKEYWQKRIKELVEHYHRSDDPAIRQSLMMSIEIALRLVKEAADNRISA